MPIKKKIIQVPVGNVPKIAQQMKCGKSAVYNALNFNSNSESARAIRKVALECYGGVNTTKLIL